VSVDSRKRKVTEDWRTRWIPQCKFSVTVRWPNKYLLSYRSEIVKANWPAPAVDPRGLLHLLVHIPFELATICDVFPFGVDERRAHGYTPYGFSNFHGGLG
jgi:hypothetical protein